jgi:hypothetical protein
MSEGLPIPSLRKAGRRWREAPDEGLRRARSLAPYDALIPASAQPLIRPLRGHLLSVSRGEGEAAHV